jgi:phage-related tail protein
VGLVAAKVVAKLAREVAKLAKVVARAGEKVVSLARGMRRLWLLFRG